MGSRLSGLQTTNGGSGRCPFQEYKRHSVPQETVLGPILFLIYINGMQENVSSTTRSFADGALVYRIIQSKRDQSLLQEDLDKLQNRESKWLMHFNPDKCEVIRITNKMNPLTQEYNICRQSRMRNTSGRLLAWICPGTVSNQPKLHKAEPPKLSNIGKGKSYKSLVQPIMEGAQWLNGRVLDSRQRGRRFEPHQRHCVVVLEQDTFILALYWFNPGRHIPV